MIIIGCDFHTRCQQIAMADDEMGELRVPAVAQRERGGAASLRVSGCGF